jgi:alpha-galactosidase
VAPTPPMGWNSWDSYGMTITEKQFRDTADVLRSRLASYGWKYAVIDEGWFFPNPEVRRPHPEQLRYQLDGFGRYVPAPRRFPTAAGSSNRIATDGHSTIDRDNRGFTELTKWVHGQGLKFGVHVVRGIPRESVRINMPIENSKFHAKDAADQSDACPWDPSNWGVRDNAAGQAWYDSLIRQYAAWGVDFLKVDLHRRQSI